VRSIKTQYFLAFAVFGSILPYLSAYLESSCGLSRVQIGHVLASSSLGVILTPVLITLLADAWLDARRLIAAAFCLAVVALLGLLLADGFWPILVAYAAFSLLVAPLIPLQDGLFFVVSEDRARRGAGTSPFHRVRVFGSVGFILPGVVLFVALRGGAPSGAILIVAMTLSSLGLANAMLLPTTPRLPRVERADGGRPMGGLPTAAALRACLEPHVLVFLVAMFLVQMAAAAFYGFFPIYLEKAIKLDMQWFGLIASGGVFVEIFFMYGFGWLLERLGIRWMMVCGALCMAMRFALMAMAPTVFVAIGTQIFHGMQVMALHVAPPLYLNDRAENHYRSSMQGLYTMVVIGVGRWVGSVLSGYVAADSLLRVFGYSAALCLAAAAMFAFVFRDGRRRPAAGEAAWPAE